MANAAHIEHKFPGRRNRKSLLEEFVRRHTSLASISELSESWSYCTGSVSSSIVPVPCRRGLRARAHRRRKGDE
jgi:hypothetical protein